MKHGDQAKAKSAKSSRKTSDKKGAAQTKSSAAGASGKAGKTTKTGTSKSGEKGSESKSDTAAEKRQSNGSPRGVAEAVGFGNPIVAAAFKRAVKKYNNAFRRLTE